jgi:hypothetical protein
MSGDMRLPSNNITIDEYVHHLRTTERGVVTIGQYIHIDANWYIDQQNRQLSRYLQFQEATNLSEEEMKKALTRELDLSDNFFCPTEIEYIIFGHFLNSPAQNKVGKY